MNRRIVAAALILIHSFHLFAQKEAANWILSPNSLLNFNSSPPTLSYAPALPFSTWESAASISDANGNLLFYTDGDTVRGADGNILPGGEDVSYIPALLLESTTQGALFLQKPGSSNLFYLFSLGHYQEGYGKGLFSYSVIDKNLNGGLGSVISKYNHLCQDTLAEKMTATKHCNGRDFWIVIVKCIATKLQDGVPIGFNYLTEFQSYLLTENGVQASPVKSVLKTHAVRLGQMKFNNKGDELAFADEEFLTLLAFDKSSGKVSLKSERKLPLKNGYGIEYAPNDQLIYINEKQYDISTNTLISVYNYPNPSQLQRGPDGKIYANNQVSSNPVIYSNSGANFTWSYANSNAMLYQRQDSTLGIAAIENPDISGIGCQPNLNYASLENPAYFNKFSMPLPNFPSFYFNHPVSEFSYNGICTGEPFQFFLNNTNIVPDSVHWVFHDTGYEVTALSPTFTFPVSGEWQVTCTVYTNGIAMSSTQCADVCGPNNVSLPEKINLCEVAAPFELNALNVCTSEYLWSTGDTTAAITIREEGTYTVQATNSCGVYTYSVEVFKGDDCKVLTEIPNIITVNDDQTNDVFSIKVKNAKHLNYSVVNRWGNLMTKGEITVPPASVFDWNTFSLWDGKTEQGEPVTNGSYFYVIEFTLFNDSRTAKNGFLEVSK
ncbi:gliding motility-associated C-terminal domain-containing protein [Fluviicola sp.]|jgi:hypothetical protein|uniref:T9SS type B sorting domain-containing protein n=1 Tax=Fluviicola sp. TaxID=1917219 RepID=UPI002833E4F2|nr:gliding motility-associated C-terminal domain-containing protein [Fluviicola sp.]MDR0802820.1 gliding motility-associated C-terminal domain-containing protein [Fluviicola sp.]